MYIGSTLATIWTIFAGAGYLFSIFLVLVQGFSLAFFIMQLFQGGENASEKLQDIVKDGTERVQQGFMNKMAGYAMSKFTGNNNSNLPF